MNTIKLKQSLATFFSATLLFVLAFALPASATTLTVDTGIYGVNGVGLTFDGNSFTAAAAELRVYFDGNNSSFLPAFCVDLAHPLSYSTNNRVTNILSPESYNAQNGLYAEWLMDSFSVQLGYTNSSINSTLTATTVSQKSSQGAGLQLAIWETFYDLYAPSRGGAAASPYSLDYGTAYTGTDIFFYNRASVDTDVNVWYDFFIQELVTEIDNGFAYTSSGDYVVTELRHERKDVQDLMTVNPVPEPATMLLFGIGLLGITAFGRKKNN